VKFGLALPAMIPGLDRDTIFEWCRRIDAGPYSSLACGERITFTNPEMMVTMSAAAALTERVELYLTVMVVPLHSAGLAAKQIATLDVLSNGRVALGVGVGGREEDFRAAERPFTKRRSTMVRKVAEMRRIWNGEAPFEGASPIGPAPVQPGGPPILVGAMGADSIRRSAQWADGICGFSFGPSREEIATGIRALDEGWREYGRSGRPRKSVTFWIALGGDGRAQMDAYVERYMKVFGKDAGNAVAPLCTTTSEAALKDAITAMEDAGADELILVPTSKDPDQIDRIADLIG
jgi:alkanesulfonate monooxygenase SsuD/methylene tetrahydromethanopterin reductase-like flavin-dependent oxidoreductase (luciferase family)